VDCARKRYLGFRELMLEELRGCEAVEILRSLIRYEERQEDDELN
jgi:hypothetical protein